MSFSAKREEVKNSLTEKCENWIIWECRVLTRESNVEHVDSTASIGSSRRQSLRYVGICPTLKSKARNSANSSTRSGRKTTATQCRSRRANSRFVPSISSNVRSYVASRVDGNSSSACRIRPGRHLARYSSWQCTHLNLRGEGECHEEIPYKCRTSRLLVLLEHQSQVACAPMSIFASFCLCLRST